MSAQGWQPIETAPRDGRFILARLGTIDNDRWSHLSGRCFVIRHEGYTVGDYDMGWALFPGLGGISDHWLAHWMPLPDIPESLPSSNKGRAE